MPFHLALLFGDMGVETKTQRAQRREAQIVGRGAFALQVFADHGHRDRVHQRDKRRAVDQHLSSLLIQLRAFFPDRVAIGGTDQIGIGLDLVIMPPAIAENAVEIGRLDIVILIGREEQVVLLLQHPRQPFLLRQDFKS